MEKVLKVCTVQNAPRMGNPGRAGTLPETCIFSADKNLNASVDTLDLHKLPFAGLGRRGLGRGGRGGRGFRGLLFGRGRTGAANEQASQHAEAKKQCDGLFHET